MFSIIDHEPFEREPSELDERVSLELYQSEVELLGKHYFEAIRFVEEDCALAQPIKHDFRFYRFAIDRLDALSHHFGPAFKAWLSAEADRRDTALDALVEEEKQIFAGRDRGCGQSFRGTDFLCPRCHDLDAKAAEETRQRQEAPLLVPEEGINFTDQEEFLEALKRI